MSLSENRRTAEPVNGRPVVLLAGILMAALWPGSAPGQAVIGGCQVFPANNV